MPAGTPFRAGIVATVRQRVIHAEREPRANNVRFGKIDERRMDL